MEEIQDQEEKVYSKWEWFFYMIVIPALFATLLGGVLLSLLGVNVIGKLIHFGNSIPYIEKIVPGQNETTNDNPKQAAQNQLNNLQTELTKNKQSSVALQEEIAKKDETIQALQKQMADVQKMVEQKRADGEERQKQYQDLAKIYTTMSSRNAAAIIANLTKEEAVTVMSKMKPEERADILAKMDPKKAADISILTKDTTVSKDDDIAALQQRIQVLTKALSETRQDGTSLDSLINTFSQMNPDDSASIIATLMNTNSKRAISILAGMSNDKRAQVLASVAKKDGNLAARITNELLR
ncbi:MotE family protein [Brevibacillus ginsengisoli]|uniref:MotE family protein n=1 Tax=Brevibacillus ginsengisoli TaxID=363854 RepID=UPI003CEB0F8E